MLKMIINSYKSYGKTFPVILLYALPLLVLASIELYFERLGSPNRGIKYFISLSLFALPLVSAATDIALYQFMLKLGKVNPFKSVKVLITYLFVQIGIGLVAIVPMVAIKSILDQMGFNSYSLFIAIIANIFLGFYFMARCSIILPLIIQDKKINLADFMKLTKRPYKAWLGVVCAIYIPYVALYYTIPCPHFNSIITTLFMFIFICFNCNFVMKNTTMPKTEPKAHAAPKMEKLKAEEKTATKKKVAAPKKVVAKKEPKAPKKTNKK